MGIQPSRHRVGVSLRRTPPAFAALIPCCIAALVACGAGPTPKPFIAARWERALPPGWEPQPCTSGVVFAAATDLAGVLAASRCRHLGDMLDADSVAGAVATVSALEAALRGPDAVAVALDAWQVGNDLQAQGTMAHVMLGNRYVEYATLFLADQVASGMRLDAQTTASMAHLAAFDPDLQRAFERERASHPPASGGCSGAQPQAFSDAMDSLRSALAFPYHKRWETLVELDDSAAREKWVAWPYMRPALDHLTASRGRARALALAVGAVDPAHALDPVTDTPVRYDPDLCAFVLERTHTLPTVRVATPCAQRAPTVP